MVPFSWLPFLILRHPGLSYFEKGFHLTPLSLSYCPIFLPPFTAKYCEPPRLHDSFSPYSSAIWLFPPAPTLTWLCLWSFISQFKDFSWFLCSSPSLQWSVWLTATCSEGSSPLGLCANVLCCCFSCPVASLSHALTDSFSFFLPLSNLLKCLCSLTLCSPFRLLPHHDFSSTAPSSCLALPSSVSSCIMFAVTLCFGHGDCLPVS